MSVQLGVEGDAGHLLPDQQRVVDPVAGLLPAPPAPAGHHHAGDGAQAQEGRLEDFAVLHPQVAPQGGQRPGAQHGHGHPVHLEGPGLVGVGGVSGFRDGLLMGLGLVGLGPLGTKGTQQQAGNDALAGAQGGQGADDRQQGVGARVQQVVVPEGAQGHVLRPVNPQGQLPGQLALPAAHGVVLGGHLADAGLGVVGGKLLLDHPVVLAAGQQGDAVHVPGQLQREGFGDGDGLEQVLHAQQGALAGAVGRHRHQGRGLLGLLLAEEDMLHVDTHTRCLFLLDSVLRFSAGGRAATR